MDHDIAREIRQRQFHLRPEVRKRQRLSPLRLWRWIFALCLIPNVILYFVGTDEARSYAVVGALPFLLGLVVSFLVDREMQRIE